MDPTVFYGNGNGPRRSDHSVVLLTWNEALAHVRIRCLEGREPRLQGDGEGGLAAQLVQGEVLPAKLADEGIPA